MPSYKFTYFDVRGRGELCRYTFLAAGRDFEDKRIVRDQWPELKPSKFIAFDSIVIAVNEYDSEFYYI